MTTYHLHEVTAIKINLFHSSRSPFCEHAHKINLGFQYITQFRANFSLFLYQKQNISYRIANISVDKWDYRMSDLNKSSFESGRICKGTLKIGPM